MKLLPGLRVPKLQFSEVNPTWRGMGLSKTCRLIFRFVSFVLWAPLPLFFLVIQWRLCVGGLTGQSQRQRSFSFISVEATRHSFIRPRWQPQSWMITSHDGWGGGVFYLFIYFYNPIFPNSMPSAKPIKYLYSACCVEQINATRSIMAQTKTNKLKMMHARASRAVEWNCHVFVSDSF